MPTQAELQKTLSKKINEWSRIKNFFGPMLHERIKNSDWLDNGLVLLLLHDYKSNLNIIENLLKNAEEESEELLQELFNELKGSERGFDVQLKNLLAELRGLSWLRDNGYMEIKKLKKSNEKTPDFEAFLVSPSLFEVKNLQKPDTLLDLVSTRLEIQELLNPDQYTLRFVVDVSDSQEPDAPINDTDRSNVKIFAKNIDDAIKNGHKKVDYPYFKKEKGKKFRKEIRCEWQSNDHFEIIGMTKKILLLSEPKRPEMLIPLLKKTFEHTFRAVEQLTEYDKADKYVKWVLLNWQKPQEYDFDDMLSDKFRELIDKTNDMIKSLNPKLNVHLL